MVDRSRFLHLERARRPGAAPEAESGTAERFEAVEPEPAPAAVPQVGEAVRERFAMAEPEPGLEVAGGEDEQPFARCAGCEVDNSRFATVCAGCGAPLSTPEQRAYNDRLWGERRKEREAERAPANAGISAEQRLMGEFLAREVAQRERKRLELGGAPWGRGPSVGQRLLRLIRFFRGSD